VYLSIDVTSITTDCHASTPCFQLRLHTLEIHSPHYLSTTDFTRSTMTRRPNVIQMSKASLDSHRSSRMAHSVLFLLAWMNMDLHNKCATAFSPRSQSHHHPILTLHRDPPACTGTGPRVWKMQGNAEEVSTETSTLTSTSTSTLTATSTKLDSNQWLTSEQVKDYALRRGVIVSLSTMGPGFRAVARSSHNETLVIGYCEGFLRPGRSASC
jgi:hypothetical protein